MIRTWQRLTLVGLAAVAWCWPARAAEWPAALLATRQAWQTAATKAPRDTVWRKFGADFPLPADWLLQDAGPSADAWLEQTGEATVEAKALATVLAELGPAGAPWSATRDQLVAAKASTTDPRWWETYDSACALRRELRLRPLLARWRTVVFAKHGPLGGSHYAYTEAQSDGQAERNFTPGAALCLLTLDDRGQASVRTLVNAPTGVIRDPDVSFDGRRIVFAWKKGDRDDDYHLYEYDTTTDKLRQLTFGLGVADYEPAYLPGGDLVFNSTRCVQTVDCWVTEVSNLYACGPDGQHLRRLSFDQVHTNYPAVLEDGRVTYTRWDYNDRGQVYPQGLFIMNPDGTGQTAHYGNNSWFPTTIAHARGIPGTQKLMAIATGHHSYQPGQLVVIDPSAGREENAGVQLIAPVRPTPAARIDAYGQSGPLFAYPYPLSASECLVAYHPYGWSTRAARNRDPGFGIYLMRADGRRELLASDPTVSCGQPVPLAPRGERNRWPDRVDYTRDSGTYYVQDVYRGPGLRGVPRGSIKKLRVVALDFRAAPIGSNGSGGPAGGAMSSTPPAIGNGCWDVKLILGDATVHPDGSAFFRVPARTPLYFQALNERNEAVQTMRTWSTLQPGENASCVGCHESKNSVPPAYSGRSQALAAGAQALAPFYGPPRGFSFPREVQPILDKHCVRCHRDREATPPHVRRSLAGRFSERNARWLVPREHTWEYTTTAPPAAWLAADFKPAGWPRGRAGFGAQGTPGGKLGTEWRGKDIWLRTRFDWAEPSLQPGRLFLSVWHDDDVEVWLNGVLALRRTGFTCEYVPLALTPEAVAAFKPGSNVLAVHCTYAGGGQAVDVALGDAAPEEGFRPPAPDRAFSLLNETNHDRGAQRLWSDGYLALTQAVHDGRRSAWRGQPGDPVNWIHVQSVPTMLPPYSAGAVKSRLLTMLDAGHSNVKLTREERDKLAAWIDLLVPYCGDYTEANAWSPADAQRYQHYLAKRERYAALEQQSVRQYLADPERRQTPRVAVGLQVVDAAGQVVHRAEAQADPGAAAAFAFERTYQAGDRLVVTGPRTMAVSVDKAWPEALVYAPEGKVDYRVPLGRGARQDGRVYPPEAFAGARHEVRVRPASGEEQATYRNVALNPLDLRGDTTCFPHATTNSECRGEPDFAARCAIDGQVRNSGHGAWPNQSWGPDQRTDLWFRVDFGRPVTVDKLALYVRADFPHDKVWERATIEFSDGSREPIMIARKAERQVFSFARRTVTWLRLTDLVQSEPLGWCACTEVEVLGGDAVPVAPQAPAAGRLAARP